MTTTASAYGDLRHLLPNNYKALISAWLEEDCPSLDYGGFVVGESEAEAKLLGKSKGIVAGIPFVDEVFAQLGCSITWHIPESHPLPANSHPTHCATVRGPIRKILLGERVALNLLARCSGIATKSHALASALRAHGWQGTLAGTRKTTPGFRVVEKYGMLVGGADPHRHDLSHMVMLKDNHVWACANNAGGGGGGGGTATGATGATAAGDDVAGAIPRAVAAAKAVGGFATKIEVECRSIEEANAAIGAGAEVVMLDNFSAEGVRAAARQLKEEWRGKAAFLIEVSGGLTEENAAAFTCPDVDVLSTSSIHQGVAIIDFSLKVSLR